MFEAQHWSFKCAVCFVPPRSVWSAHIQETRCFNDKSFVRWPPHMTLIYPFRRAITEMTLSIAAQELRQCLQNIPPFRVTFERTKLFDHGQKCTVWLEPIAEELKEVHDALVAAFPDCDHRVYNRYGNIKDFIPHLSLGQWRNRKEAKAAITRLLADLSPIDVIFDSVFILQRKAYRTPFEFKYKVPLEADSDDAIETINVGYVATLESDEESCAAHPYGLGSYAEGVWHFVYGPNMDPDQLTEVYGLTSLEFVVAFLDGYQLVFNHCSGMSNIEPMPSERVADFQNRQIYGVHGVLHRFSFVDSARLTNMESRCRPVEMNVKATDNRGYIKAVVYITPLHQKIGDDLPPPEQYLQHTIKAAERMGLDRRYIKWLESIEAVTANTRSSLYWRSVNGQDIGKRFLRVAAETYKNK